MSEKNKLLKQFLTSIQNKNKTLPPDNQTSKIMHHLQDKLSITDKNDLHKDTKHTNYHHIQSHNNDHSDWLESLKQKNKLK